MLTCGQANSQYLKIELLRIETKTILPENYSQIILPGLTVKGKNWNRYDTENMDTFIEILQDDHHNRSHILVQTDFFGNVQYTAVSNNIYTIINKKDKPKFVFDHCMEDLNNGFSGQQENIDKIIACITERLETCCQK